MHWSNCECTGCKCTCPAKRQRQKVTSIFLRMSTFIEYGYILAPLPEQGEGKEFGRALQLLRKEGLLQKEFQVNCVTIC